MCDAFFLLGHSLVCVSIPGRVTDLLSMTIDDSYNLLVSRPSWVTWWCGLCVLSSPCVMCSHQIPLYQATRHVLMLKWKIFTIWPGSLYHTQVCHIKVLSSQNRLSQWREKLPQAIPGMYVWYLCAPFPVYNMVCCGLLLAHQNAM